MMPRTDPRITLLLEMLDATFDGTGWNGVTLRGCLRGITAKQAAWRPRPDRLCIWQYVLHCAWWKHEVRQRIGRGAAIRMDRGPANLPAMPDKLTDAAWRADINLLEAEHAALRKVVAGLRPSLLALRPRKRWRRIEEIHGIAEHDAYHTGQIQLLKALMR